MAPSSLPCEHLVCLLVPTDDYWIAWAEAKAGRRASGVLPANDELAGAFGVNAVFGLITQVGTLANPTHDAGPTGCRFAWLTVFQRLDSEALRANGDGHLVPD